MSVGEICNREVVVLRKEESITEAVKLMREHHVGSVVIVDEPDGERIPIGILTDRDIVVELLAQGVDLDTVAVGDAMSYDLLTVGETDHLSDAVKVMRSKGVRRVPVVNEYGGLAGILAVDDVIEIIAEELTDLVSVITVEQGRERIYRQ